MLRSLLLTIVYVSFLGIGIGAAAPFVAALGYIWTDAARPQSATMYVLNGLPVSQIMGIAAFGGYLLFDRRDPPRFGATMILTALFAVWITMSAALWAVSPVAAWEKWDWAFKAVAFSIFLPFVFRSRVQIEAFLLVFLFSLLFNTLAPGLKTMISGGGYGQNLGFESGNSMFGEGGFLSAAADSAILIALYLGRHTIVLPKSRVVTLGFAGIAVTLIAASVGTYERSGLVGLAVVGGFFWLKSRHKMAIAAVAAVGILVLGAVLSERWMARMDTIATYKEDTSALVRLEVWKWTLGFVSENPLGGGFDAYRINTIQIAPGPGHPELVVQHGRAFHSIYFEVLGEQGWPGLLLFFALIATSIARLLNVIRRTRGDPDLQWCVEASRALIAAMLSYLACGIFVGIAYQPELWYYVAGSVCVGEYVRRVQARPVSPRASVSQQLEVRHGVPRPVG